MSEATCDNILRSYIERSGIEEKAAVEYIPCDLADAGWTTLLRGAGFKAEDKSFGSLLGLSYYLDRDSFRGLLRSISDLWSDGSVVCTYIQRNENVASMSFTWVENELVSIKVITSDQLRVAWQRQTLMNEAFIAVYIVEAAVCLIVFLSKKKKLA